LNTDYKIRLEGKGKKSKDKIIEGFDTRINDLKKEIKKYLGDEVFNQIEEKFLNTSKFSRKTE
jgi:hypothetical protein